MLRSCRSEQVAHAPARPRPVAVATHAPWQTAPTAATSPALDLALGFGAAAAAGRGRCPVAVAWHPELMLQPQEAAADPGGPGLAGAFLEAAAAAHPGPAQAVSCRHQLASAQGWAAAADPRQGQTEGGCWSAWAADCATPSTLSMQAGAARFALQQFVPAAGVPEAGWPAGEAAAGTRCPRCCSAQGTNPTPAAGQMAEAHPSRRRHWSEEAPAATAEGRTGAAPARAASQTEAPPVPRPAAVRAAGS